MLATLRVRHAMSDDLAAQVKMPRELWRCADNECNHVASSDGNRESTRQRPLPPNYNRPHTPGRPLCNAHWQRFGRYLAGQQDAKEPAVNAVPAAPEPPAGLAAADVNAPAAPAPAAPAPLPDAKAGPPPHPLNGLSFTVSGPELEKLVCEMQCASCEQQGFNVVKRDVNAHKIRFVLECKNADCNAGEVWTNASKRVHLTELGQSHLGPGLDPDTLRTVAAALLSGGSFEQTNFEAIIGGSHAVARSTFFRYSDYVWAAVEACWKRESAAQIDRLKQLSDWRALIDGAWSHFRGNKANDCIVTCMDADTDTIITIAHVHRDRTLYGLVAKQGNFSGDNAASSKAMEPFGVQMIVKELKDKDLLRKLEALCSDRDASINAIMTELKLDVKHNYDPGHIKR
jgi:hypothetical protein